MFHALWSLCSFPQGHLIHFFIILLPSLQAHSQMHWTVLSRWSFWFVINVFFLSVDSIGWVRDDSIVVGSVRLNEEGNEEGYLVQVIRSGGNTFFEVSLSFSSSCFCCVDYISWNLFFIFLENDVSFLSYACMKQATLNNQGFSFTHIFILLWWQYLYIFQQMEIMSSKKRGVVWEEQLITIFWML